MAITKSTELVLQAFMMKPDEALCGYDLIQACGLRARTLYPILERLLTAEWIEGHWETLPTEHEGRPPRHRYRLTTTGRQHATNALVSSSRRRTNESIFPTPLPELT